MSAFRIGRRRPLVALTLFAVVAVSCSDGSAQPIAAGSPSTTIATALDSPDSTVAWAAAPTGAVTAATEASGSSGDATVDIRLVAFKPEVVQIPAGGTVRWVQQDPGAHTVTSGTVADVPGGVEALPDGAFDSESLAAGDTFTFTGSTSGRVTYFCKIHPATIRGVVEIS